MFDLVCSLIVKIHDVLQNTTMKEALLLGYEGGFSRFSVWATGTSNQLSSKCQMIEL